MISREKYRGEYLAGKKVAFYDGSHLNVGEVRLHQGEKVLVLTKKGWRKIKVNDVRKVYDGGKDGSN